MIKISDKVTQLGLRLGFFFWLLQLVIILLFWRKLPPKLPLFYSRPWGERQLVAPDTLLLLPGISLLVALINFTLSLLLIKNEKLLSNLLLVFAIIFNFLCFFTLYKIITMII